MRTSIQYLNDSKGKTVAVQLPLTEWEELLSKLRKYEQILRVKSDLNEAYAQVKKMKEGKIKKQTLSDFLNAI